MKERYITTNGIRLYAVEAGDGPLVLFCHGFPEFWWSWHEQVAAVAEAGFRAVAIDMPGYGKSDKPDVRYDIVFISDCLAGIPSAFGARKMALVGHDWGGMVVWAFARLYSEMTASVVGVNTPDIPRPPAPPVEILRRLNPDQPMYIVQFQDPGVAEWIIYQDLRGWFELMFRGFVTNHPERFGDDLIDRYVEVFRPIGALTPPLDYYRNMDRNWELTAPVADRKIEQPCLMVMAENDPVLRPSMADGMESRVPNLKKVLIEDCGHWTQIEKPDELNSSLVEFLAGIEPWE